MKKRSPEHQAYYVLLINSNPHESEHYADLLREVGNCKVDVMTRLDPTFGWVDRSNYHLVVLDIPTLRASLGSESSTNRNSVSVLDVVKRISPSTSVILLSDRPDLEQAVSAIRMGAEDYLKKPFSMDAFKMAAKRGLDRKTIFGENQSASKFLNLLTSCQMISATLEQSKIFRIIQSYFAMDIQSNYSAIFSVENDKARRLEERGGKEGRDLAMEQVLEISIQNANPFQAMIEQDLDYRFVERGTLSPGLFIFRFQCVDPRDYFYVGLSPVSPEQLDSFESRLRMFRTQIEVTGKNIRQYQGVRELAYLDEVTGLYNTRYLYEVLDREVETANSKKTSFAVLFVDCDHFKKVNDQYGHLVGSKLLAEVAVELNKQVRNSDTVFRYGGDEFVAVLSPCDLVTAKRVAERIRSAIEDHQFVCEEGKEIRITVSIGVALFPEHASNQQDVIEVADKVMYTAKSNRNSVYVAKSKAAPKIAKGS